MDQDMPRVVQRWAVRPSKWRERMRLVFETLAFAASIAAIGLLFAGCAVSLSFQPATWQPAAGKTQAETRAK